VETPVRMSIEEYRKTSDKADGRGKERHALAGFRCSASHQSKMVSVRSVRVRVFWPAAKGVRQ